MYLLDSNVFIGAHQFHYSFDFHPGFWDWLIQTNLEGKVFSIEKVYEEISQQEDQLYEWAQNRKGEFFLENPPDIDGHLKHVTDCVNRGNYKPTAIEEFLKSADYYLIGYALFSDFRIVTHEVPRSRKGRIKIPSVCQVLGVECITPFDMLRQENARFVLDPLQ
ncbi:MAG: DUF4411 family protein [Bacteroidota bacterium]|nr:DUF4411 family protein [Bacteroidota bacterium]